jgi:hypothetical protein
MGAFNLTRADGKTLRHGALVVELVLAMAQVSVALSYRRIAIRNVRFFKMWLKGLQYFVGLLRFEPSLLFVHPGRSCRVIVGNRRCGRTQVFAHMVEIQQVTALRAKLRFDLVSDPRGAIAYRMDRGASAKACLCGARQDLLTGGINVALQGAAIGQCLAPMEVRQTNLGLFPVQFLALALVLSRAVRLDDRHHPAVHLDDDRGTVATLKGPTRPYLLGGLEYPLGMALSDVPNGAFAEDDAVVFDKFVHDLGEGQVCSKIGDSAL